MLINLRDFLHYDYGWTKPYQFNHKMTYREMVEHNLWSYKPFVQDIKYLTIRFVGSEHFRKKYKYEHIYDILNEIYKEIKLILGVLHSTLEYLVFTGFNSFYSDYLW